MTRTALGRWIAAAALVFCAAIPAVAGAAGYYPGFTRPALVPSLGGPSDVALALNGELFVADGANGRVAVVVNGVVVRDWDGSGGAGPELVRPTGICIGPDDLVYVADAGADRVVVYQRSGTWVRTIGTRGSANGQLLGPFDVAVDAGGVWVADTVNDRVQKFTLAGVWSKTVGGGSSGMFQQPISLELSGTRVYVSEAVGRKGQAFDATTNAVVVLPWGITDSGGGVYVSRYERPAGIDVDASSRVFMADAGRSLVEQLTLAGAIVNAGIGGTTHGLDQPAGVLSQGDDLFVADPLNDRVARYRLAAPAAWTTPIAPGGSSAPGAFTAPAAIAALPGGGYVVADTGAARIQRLDATGALHSVFSTAGAGALGEPRGIVATGGEVFVADASAGHIKVFSAVGTYLRTLGSQGSGAGQFASPSGLSLDPAGNLLVADTGNDRIQRITPAGAHLQTIGAGTLSAPGGVAVDGAGTIYVADTGSHRVRTFSAAGVAGAVWGSFGSTPGQLISPAGISVHPLTGEVFVADTENHRIQAFSASGVFQRVIGGRGTAADELRSPASVAHAPSGAVLIADTGNHRVAMVDYDGTPPVTTASGIPGAWMNAPVTVTLSATDSGSGVAATYYRLGEGPAVEYTVPFTVEAEGSTLVRYWSVDALGNEEPVQEGTVRLDSVPPAGTMTVAGGAALVGRTVTIESNITGDPRQMAIDPGTGTFGAKLPYSPTATATLPIEGLRTVRVRYFDALDNALTLSAQVTVDVTAPALSLSAAPASAQTSGAVTVTLAANDAVSGVATRFLRIDGGIEQPYLAPAVIVAEGTHTVAARAVDQAGNVATSSVSFLIDRTAPTVSLVGVSDGALVNAPVTMTLAGSDALTGVSALRYTLDGGAEREYTGPLTVDAEGAHAITYRGVDGVGNATAPATTSFTIDRRAPRTWQVGAPSGWQDGEVTFTLGAADDGPAGLAATYYRLGNGPTVLIAPGAPITVTAEGETVVRFWSADGAGNVETASSVTVRIDRSAPFTTDDAEPVYRGPARIVLAATDAGAGVADTVWRIGGGEWRSGTVVNVADAGQYTLEYRSTDALGNLEAVRTAEFMIDDKSPRTIAVGAPEGWQAGAVRFTLEATDAGPSGVAATYYRLGKGEPVPYDGEVTVTEEGPTVVTFWSVDGVGNTEEPSTVLVGIDTQAPVSQVAGVPDGWSGSAVSLSLFATDYGSGLASIRYSVGGDAPQTYSGPISVATEGETSITYWATDAAGNSESPRTVDVRIDLTGPKTELTGVPAGWVDHDVVLHLDAADTGGSGVATTYYRLGEAAPVALDPGETVVIRAEGETLFRCWTVDGAGNVEQQHSATVRIDRTAPVTVSDALPTYRDTATVTLSATDAGSGVAKTHWRLDAGSWQEGTVAEVTGQGEHQLEFYSVDRLGNEEAVHSEPLVIGASVRRVAGASRYALAVEAARATFGEGPDPWAGVTDLVIASGEDRAAADPLSAAALCGGYRAPLLLVRSSGAIDAALATAVTEIAIRNPALTVHVVGGAASVPDARIVEIRAVAERAGATVTEDRLVRAGNRYDLSAAIARRAASLVGSATTVVVANGADSTKFFDALALSPISAWQVSPLLLVARDSVPAATASVLAEFAEDGAVRVIIGGGEASVSGAVQRQLGTIAKQPAERWSGPTRYHTATTIATRALAEHLLSAEQVAVAAKLPDALTGGAMTGVEGGVLLLSESGRLAPETGRWISEHAADIGSCRLYGGERSVSPGVETAVAALLD